MATPVPVDQGLLSILNSKLPGCEFNTRVAQWYSSNGAAKSVPKGTPCPDGYNPIPEQSDLASNATYQACGKNSATGQMPQEYIDGFMACKTNSQLARATPPPAPVGIMNWLPWLIIAIILIFGAVGIYFISNPPRPANVQ
jgi:hypothetical protein